MQLTRPGRSRASSGAPSKPLRAVAAMAFALLVSVLPATAQTPLPLPAPGAAPLEAIDKQFAPLDLNAPKLTPPPLLTPGVPAAGMAGDATVAITMRAKLVTDGPEVPSGLAWRVFGDATDDTGKLPLLATAAGGPTTFDLKPGTYLVHVAYGAAGATKRIDVGQAAHDEVVVVNAGGLRLHGAISQDQPIRSDQLVFEVYSGAEEEGGDRRLLVPNAKDNRIVRLNAGTYHVVSKYGEANAVVRADIRVEAGKLTDATIYHKAAEVTLKLVSEAGGEALANTAWVVLSPGGDVVKESVGAFPSFVLAAGEYSVIARHEGETFNRDFTVEPGVDADVEVVAQEPTAASRNGLTVDTDRN